MSLANLAQATIVERHDIAEYLWTVKLRPDIPFSFKAGQYCTIGVNGVERPYSIVSAPDEPLLELFIELISSPLGILTPVLHRLGVGDTVTLRPRAKGIFVLDERYRNHLMVATVTGICPYVSIVRQHLIRGKGDEHRFAILDGASYHDELGYRGELERLAREHEFIHYVPTVSRPQEERNACWQGETGRVNTLVEKYVEEFGLSPQDTLIYACGNPGMIDDVRQRAAKLEFPFLEERFWKEE